MNPIRLLFIITLAVLSTNASAVYDTGIFFGGNVGYADLSDESGATGSQLTQAGFTGNSIDVDDNDLGWKVFFGYAFSQYFGLEVGYHDLGGSRTNITTTAPVAIGLTTKTGISGYSASVVARWPVLDRLELLTKFGGFFWDVDAAASTTIPGLNLATVDDDGTDMTAGLGVKVKLTEHIGIRAEWDRYIDVSDFESDINMFSMGLEFTY